MKKLLTILLVLISFSSFAQFEAGEFVNSDTTKIRGSSIIFPHADSVEQFYYSKMRDPSEPLDGVNLRTLFDRLASLDTLGLNVSDLVSGTQIINAGETQIFFPSAFDSTNVIVVPFVRRISDNAVIDFIINDIDSLGFDVVVWEDGCKIQYVASQKITHSSDIFKEPIYSADSAYLKSHVRTDFDTDSTNEIQDLSGLVPFLGADRDLDLGANSINTDTVKINGVPLLLNTFKKDNLGGAGNIFYSTGASSQPASGTVNQVIGNGLMTINTIPKWTGSYFSNSIVREINGRTCIGNISNPYSLLHIKGADTKVSIQGADASGGTQGVQFLYGDALFAGYIGSVTKSGGGGAVVILPASNSFTQNEAARFNHTGNTLLGTSTDNNTDKLQVNGSGYFNTNLTVNGIAIADVLKSRVPTGTAPLVVASSTKVDSLNVDLLDGKHQSDFLKYTDSVIESDTIKARADIIVTGEIYDKINHLYGMVYDSTITLSLTQNVWQQVTNATKTLYSTAEQDGVTISSDTIVFSKAGGYDVSFEFNCTGINSKDYHYRILQKNGTTTVRSYNKYASTGTQVLRNEKAYVHVAAGSKVWCEIMSPSSAPGNVTIQGAKVYAMQCYLEK